jgi:hypothetical protein
LASSINASTSSGVVTTADTSGVLNIQTAGTTAISIDASQAVTMAGRTSNPTTISVGAATPSTSGAGITFPATQSASTNANTLDDYEEGTWTPYFFFTTTQQSTGPYNEARYVKVGQLVTLMGIVSLGTKSGTGNLQIGNLPFVAATQAGWYSGNASGIISNFTGYTGWITLEIGTGFTRIVVLQTGTGTGAVLTDANINNNGYFEFSISYPTS